VLAAELARTTTRDNPEFIESHIVLAAALGHLDRAEDARVAIEKFRDVDFEYIEQRPTWSENMASHTFEGLCKAGLSE